MMKNINSKIISIGHYLPKKIYDNKYLESIVETSNEWIVERTGIEERHIAEDNEYSSDLAYYASAEAIKNANIDKNEVDAIIVATITPDNFFPSTATILQKKLGINNKCFAFDIQAACSGFVYALTIADSLIKNEKAKNILVVGTETLSKLVNWKDRNTCVLFGDGAGAVILQKTNEENKGIIFSNLHSDGEFYNILKTNGNIGSYKINNPFIEMEGKEVFKYAVTKMFEGVKYALQQTNLSINDISLLIPHQANKRILENVANKLNLDQNKYCCYVNKHGNTSAASIPLALSVAFQENRIKNNDIIIFEALGAGLTWGSIVLRW